MSTHPEPTLAMLSRALDEIWLLRNACAYERAVLAATLGLASFPKSRRPIAQIQVERLRLAANGHAPAATLGLDPQLVAAVRRDLGLSARLTLQEWLGEPAVAESMRQAQSKWTSEIYADKVDQHLLARALDEISALRRVLAYDSAVLASHLTLKTFPVSRRPFTVRARMRMNDAATGHVTAAYRDATSRQLQQCRSEAGMADTLTRGAWEAEQRAAA